MPDISIQFYAAPDELLSFVMEVMRDYALHAVTMRYRPFEAKAVDISNLESLFAPSSEFRRWAFTVDTPRLPVEHELDHADKNPDHLRLDVGKLSDGSLEESWLSCRTQNMVVYSIWKKIAKRLKDRTLAGITARNRQNGIQSEYRQFRYSQGAKELEDQGVTILAHVGPKGPEIKLGLLLSKPSE